MKLKIFFQILFLTVSFNNFGQISNDSIISKKYNHPKKEYSIDFFFRFPVGSFGQNFKPDGSSAMSGILESIEGTNGGMGAEMGYEIEFSRYCFFNKKTSNTNFGLKITYLSFSSIPFNWATSGDYIYNNADFSNLDFLSFKAGPVLRIAISEKKSFQFYDQLCLTYGWNGGWKLDTAYYVNNYRVSDQSEFKLQTGWGVRNEIGIFYRTHHLMIGLGYSFGKVKYNNADYNRFASTSGYSGDANLDLQPQMPITTINFSFSLRLGK